MTKRGGGAAPEEVGREGDGGHATALLSAKLITRGQMLRFAQHDNQRRGRNPRGSREGRRRWAWRHSPARASRRDGLGPGRGDEILRFAQNDESRRWRNPRGSREGRR